MTGLVRAQLTGLARTLAELRERVRAAVAGELGRAVGEAVRQVVQAVAAGRADATRLDPPAYRRPAADRWDDRDEDDGWGRPRDPWAGGRGGYDDYDPDGGTDRDDDRFTPARPDPAVATAVAAGVCAARWWLGRKGSWLAAAGLGLGVGLLGVLGGPAARTAVAALAAAADVLATTDALGSPAARLDHL